MQSPSGALAATPYLDRVCYGSVSCAARNEPPKVIARIQPYILNILFVVWGRGLLPQLNTKIIMPFL